MNIAYGMMFYISLYLGFFLSKEFTLFKKLLLLDFH